MARKPKSIIVDDEPEDEELTIRKQLVDEYVVVLRDPYMLWDIKPALPGTPLPKELRGSYTTEVFAKRAVEDYKRKKEL